MINLIVAISQNNVIGHNNDLLWHISEDLRRFKALTTGNTILMGRKTYDSLPVRPLPNRKNVVLTHQDVSLPGVTVLHSLDEIEELQIEGELYIIGGARIYEQTLPLADRLYITWVWKDFSGDTTLDLTPILSNYKLIEETPRFTDPKSGLEYSFYTYQRI